MKNYRCWDLIDDEQPELWGGGTRVYEKTEVDAELDAKDAENNRIRHVLQQLLIDSNGKIRADHWNRAMSALEMNDAPPPPHPDTARLDKLPALRDLVDRVWNEATESEQVPSTEWADRIIKKWIDAHEEPKL